MSSGCPQQLVAFYRMTKDNTDILGHWFSWVTYKFWEVTGAVLLPALTVAVQECRYFVCDVFTAGAVAHTALCNHGGLQEEFSHTLIYTPVPARSMCGNFRAHCHVCKISSTLYEKCNQEQLLCALLLMRGGTACPILLAEHSQGAVQDQCCLSKAAIT